MKFSTFFEKKDPLDTPQEEIPEGFLSLHFSKRPYCHFLRLKNYQILSLKKYQCCKFEIFKNAKITIYPRKPEKRFLVLKGLSIQNMCERRMEIILERFEVKSCVRIV